MRGALAGAGLDSHLDLLGTQRLDHVGDKRHAALSLCGLLWDSDLHPDDSAINGGHKTRRRD